MELRVLQYFLAVAREQSISAAAESLHLSQPTLSIQLKNLEEELGKRLMIRGTPGSRQDHPDRGGDDPAQTRGRDFGPGEKNRKRAVAFGRGGGRGHPHRDRGNRYRPDDRAGGAKPPGNLPGNPLPHLQRQRRLRAGTARPRASSISGWSLGPSIRESTSP